MDIDMPHVDGIAGVALIRKQFKDVKILMQTVFEDNEKIFDAILAGANGYLLKQTAPTKLIEGIIEVAQGGAPMTPIVAQGAEALRASGNGSSKTVDFNLTDREVEILRYLVDGYSYKMIAEKCNISYATVNTHVSHIYEKLQVKSVAGAVSLAVREGLV
jgi:DNA-binding NarL/FixJ family response regulator